MAKVIGPLHSTEARGRCDSLVYNTWRGIRWVKAYVAPQFGSPDPREAQKARVAAATAAWKLLTNAQRNAWSDYAQLHPILDWSGVPIRLTGANWFISCYTRILRVAGTLPTLPPHGSPPYPLATWAVTQSGNNAHLVWTYPTEPEPHTYYVQILRQGPYSLGRQPDFHHASILTHELIATSPYDDPLTIAGKYTYWARVLDAVTGLMTPLLLASLAFVPAPATGGITGRCWDGVSGMPGIHVDINGHTAITGALGIFTQLGLAHGTYTVAPWIGEGPWAPPSKQAHVDPPATTDVGDFLWSGA